MYIDTYVYINTYISFPRYKKKYIYIYIYLYISLSLFLSLSTKCMRLGIPAPKGLQPNHRMIQTCPTDYQIKTQNHKNLRFHFYATLVKTNPRKVTKIQSIVV